MESMDESCHVSEILSNIKREFPSPVIAKPVVGPEIPPLEDALPLLNYSKNSSTWTGSDGTEVKIRIQNLVYTCNIFTTLNLNHVAQKLKRLGAQLNRKRFAAVIIRYRNPKIAILLFCQGNIVCTGAKDINQARFMVLNTIEELKKIGYKNARIVNGLNLENLVASVVLPWSVNVASLTTQYSAFCTYDPDLFPGVIMRYTPVRPMTDLVFKSGKMVVTGAKSLQDVMKNMDAVVPLIKQHMVAHQSGTMISPSTQDRFVKPVAFLNQLAREEMKGTKNSLTSTSAKPVVTPARVKDSVKSITKRLKKATIKQESDNKPVVIQHMPDFFKRG